MNRTLSHDIKYVRHENDLITDRHRFFVFSDVDRQLMPSMGREIGTPQILTLKNTVNYHTPIWADLRRKRSESRVNPPPLDHSPQNIRYKNKQCQLKDKRNARSDWRSVSNAVSIEDGVEA